MYTAVGVQLFVNIVFCTWKTENRVWNNIHCLHV